MLLSVFSTILLILAFPNFNLSYLAFVGFVPLFFVIRSKKPKQAFWISYLCGFLFYLGTLYWLYHVTIFGLIIVCLYLALYFGIFGFLFNRIAFGLQPSAFSFFLIPLIWIGFEYLQSNLFTGFGWTLLGYSQYKNLALIQIADFSGVYGVSFVIMMVNIGVYRFFKRSLKEIVIAGLVLAAAIGYGKIPVPKSEIWYGARGEDKGEQGKKIRVSVVQGNIPQEMKWDPAFKDEILERYANLTRLAAFDDPDLIIWPETSFPGFFGINKDTQEVLGLARKIDTPLLIGANTSEGLDSFNSAVLISERGKVVDRYDKIHLVPYGEYVPFSDKIPFLHRLVLGELGEFTAGKEYKAFSLETSPVTAGGHPSPNHSRSLSRARPRGSGTGQAAFSQNIKFATLICFEDIFPKLARRFVQNGAEFLIVITNDAWYGRSGAPYQHAASSVFRAIENRIPIVRCANTGYSCFIDSRGRIYDAVEENNTHLFVTGHKTSTLEL
ncbi:MAG: apolipoprotein N-acyltransferase [Candidatus Omnitrophica bacterium]|nr:apolipoprotein N-acyltransferase [Candidatus Omnitrophota bacterium]MBU4457123.1 apolipoprotein N-acyltransferase [Candidatus Omnitrophota bacterium]